MRTSRAAALSRGSGCPIEAGRPAGEKHLWTSVAVSARMLGESWGWHGPDPLVRPARRQTKRTGAGAL